MLRLVDGFAVDEPAGPQPPVAACALLVAVGANGVGVFCLRPALAATPGIVWDRAGSNILEYPLEKRSLADGLHRDHAGGPNCSQMAALLGGIRAHPCCDSRTRRQIGPAIGASMITREWWPRNSSLVQKPPISQRRIVGNRNPCAGSRAASDGGAIAVANPITVGPGDTGYLRVPVMDEV